MRYVGGTVSLFGPEDIGPCIDATTLENLGLACEWPDAATRVEDIRYGALFYKACNNVGDISFDWRGKGDLQCRIVASAGAKCLRTQHFAGIAEARRVAIL